MNNHVIRKWQCGEGHTFSFGGEDWHYEQCQFVDDDGYPVPMYCTHGMCMDSSHLILLEVD